METWGPLFKGCIERIGWLKRMLNQARYPVSHSLAPNPKLCLLQCTGVSSLTQKPLFPNNSHSGPCPVKLFRITDFRAKGHRKHPLRFAYPETRRLVEESAMQSWSSPKISPQLTSLNYLNPHLKRRQRMGQGRGTGRRASSNPGHYKAIKPYYLWESNHGGGVQHSGKIPCLEHTRPWDQRAEPQGDSAGKDICCMLHVLHGNLTWWKDGTNFQKSRSKLHTCAHEQTK